MVMMGAKNVRYSYDAYIEKNCNIDHFAFLVYFLHISTSQFLLNTTLGDAKYGWMELFLSRKSLDRFLPQASVPCFRLLLPFQRFCIIIIRYPPFKDDDPRSKLPTRASFRFLCAVSCTHSTCPAEARRLTFLFSSHTAPLPWFTAASAVL
jgi:hypothetical protein